MEISSIPDAEREASEVLHSLLPVERIEKRDDHDNIAKADDTNSNGSDQWDHLSLNRRKLRLQTVEQKRQDDEIGEIVDVELSDSDEKSLLLNAHPIINYETSATNEQHQKLTKTKKTKASQKKSDLRRRNDDKEAAPTALESSVSEVSLRLAAGCECQGVCFKNMQAESVYRHRLNIAELTKQEHDMYLMGVTMACLSNRTETNRHKERIRQRAVYVFQGKRVCLDAFIYLENVTQYHLKRIRRHVMVNGVTPRVHGNVRKKPHNALSLDLYKFAENFVKSELTQHSNDLNKSIIVMNEPRINLYQKFRANCPIDEKLMSYSTFRHFLKKQFPHVRFNLNRPLENYSHRDRLKTMKREKKNTPIKIEQTNASSSFGVKKKTKNGGDYETEAASDGDPLEICVEFLGNDDSCDSDINEYNNDKLLDPKSNEYQDVDFLESEDE